MLKKLMLLSLASVIFVSCEGGTERKIEKKETTTTKDTNAPVEKETTIESKTIEKK